jgi:hypothetical protein
MVYLLLFADDCDTTVRAYSSSEDRLRVWNGYGPHAHLTGYSMADVVVDGSEFVDFMCPKPSVQSPEPRQASTSGSQGGKA